MKLAHTSNPSAGASRPRDLDRSARHGRRGALRRGAAFLALALAAFAPERADAQVVDPNLWVTNGPVLALVRDGNTIYIGGRFTEVGPATGSGVPIDAGSGIPLPGFAKVIGFVQAIVPDGVGGWYIGGHFTSVGGVARSNVAHIASDLTVTAWNPSADSTVCALALSGSTVYAGGHFHSIGGQARNHIAALDAISGAATAWNPNASGTQYAFVASLAVANSTVYAGGWFYSIGGQARNNIAALDATTGAAKAWDPNANTLVSTLAVGGGTVYAGGHFTSIGGQARNYIAALDAASGAATAWNPSASYWVHTLAVSGSTVYAGGYFTSVGGQARNYIAALDAASGAATTWNPNANKRVEGLAVSGSTVYAGGDFTSIGGQTRHYIAALDAASGAATDWNPNANGWVYPLAVSGSTVYAGGQFTSIGGQTRNAIAALDATSGAATAWNPNASGSDYPSVNALAVSGSTVYAGGWFDSIGGQGRNCIAALDATSGAATAWNPNASGGDHPSVNALAVSGSTVYACGGFTAIGGQGRNHIAALDAASGAATDWNPNADDRVNTLAVSDSMVYAGGTFTSIGGQARSHIAALDATSGAATAWDPNASGGGGPITPGVYALAVSGSTVYAGGDFTSIGGQTRNAIAALDATSGAATDWNPDPDGCWVAGLAVNGSTVYAGGWFTSIGGQGRNYIAALDATTGAATAWNPNADHEADAFAVSGSTVYAGGGFTSIGGLPQSYVAAISADAPTSVSLGDDPVRPDLQAWPSPAHGQVTIAFSLEAASAVALEVYDVSGRRVGSSPRVVLGPGRQTLSWDGRDDAGRGVSPGVYLARVSTPEGTKTARVVIVK